MPAGRFFKKTMEGCEWYAPDFGYVWDNGKDQFDTKKTSKMEVFLFV
jgi:hypothetical protein